MVNDNNLNEAEQIVQDIKDKKKITSGKYAVVIDGKTYVMHRDGGDYGYMPPYPKNSDGGNCTHTTKQDDTTSTTINSFHSNTKVINGKTDTMQNDTCSQPIEDTSSQNEENAVSK